MDNSDRRKEILNVCLDTFINKGLSETTVRDLSTALKLQSGGIYYWFKDKDEAVVACAEEAALRLENSLIFPALKDIKDPDKMMKRQKNTGRRNATDYEVLCKCMRVVKVRGAYAASARPFGGTLRSLCTALFKRTKL